MSSVFAQSHQGHRCSKVSATTPHYELDAQFTRKAVADLPELSEIALVRHMTTLSRKTHGVDAGMYPLGSCTMKYNPKLHEAIAQNPAFSAVHPLQDEMHMQGSLFVMHDLADKLARLTGMDAFSLAPAAGAHGEFTALLMIRAYFAHKGEDTRSVIIIPDSAHGTNPASAKMAGFSTVSLASNKNGTIDLDALRQLLTQNVAGLMLTNPNTAGLFEKDIHQIAKMVHDNGSILYYDGANLNAIMGNVQISQMGFDILHLNLHKTFSTPHGGGGPGSGPIGCKAFLEPFLPVPRVCKKDGILYLDRDRPLSIGQISDFYGNFGVFIKAYAYILTLGSEGLAKTAQYAVLNANYLRKKLKDAQFSVYFDSPCMHEFVLSLESCKKDTHVRAIDIAKALIDYGIHPPTMYFPLIVPEALMIEPTETETKASLDTFVEVMHRVLEQAHTEPAVLQNAPHTAAVRRVDEVSATRKPVVKE